MAKPLLRNAQCITNSVLDTEGNTFNRINTLSQETSPICIKEETAQLPLLAQPNATATLIITPDIINTDPVRLYIYVSNSFSKYIFFF